MRLAALLVPACVLAILTPSASVAQAKYVENDVAAWSTKVNFAIPDAPAFELLKVDPNAILKPASTRELTAALSKFVSADGSFGIPQALAIEFSPKLLGRSDRAAQADLEANPRPYNIRLSLAALRGEDSDAAARRAIGLRITLADQSQKDAQKRAESYVDGGLSKRVKRIYAEALARQRGMSAADVNFDSIRGREKGFRMDRVMLSEEESEELEHLERQVRKKFAESTWNATRIEFALATAASAADASGRDPKLDSVAGWLTASLGLGTWGQGMFGLRGAGERGKAPDGSLASRFYAGNQRAKSYIEAQGTVSKTSPPKWLGSAGLEVAATDWLWLNFTVGVEGLGREAHTTSSFKLKSALPGK